MAFYKLMIVIVSIVFISGCATTKTEKIRMDQLPGDVEFAILDKIGEGVIENVEFHSSNKRDWYSVEYSSNGNVQQIYLTPAGDLIESDPGTLF